MERNDLMGEKKLDKLVFLSDRYYYEEHTWAKVEGEHVKVGISDFAQDSLGDIIFFELPEVGAVLNKGEEFGQAESAKVTSSLYMPISGEIINVNIELEDTADIVNQEPYEAGWMIVIKPNHINEIDELLTDKEYIQLLQQD